MRHKVDRLARIARFWELRKHGLHQEAMDFLRTFVAQRPDGEVCFLFGCQLFAGNELADIGPCSRAEEVEQRRQERCWPNRAAQLDEIESVKHVADYREDPVSHAYAEFYGSDAHRTCGRCGHVTPRPPAKA